MDDAEARELLQAERERLTALLAAQNALVDQQDADAGTDAGQADDARRIVDRELVRSERDQLAGELAEVEAAFLRLEEGRYGVSVESGAPIPDERLRAVPHARRTAEEQERVDAMGRADDPENPERR